MNEDVCMYDYKLIDIFGREIASGKIQSEYNNGILLKYDHLKNGIYIIEIYNGYSRIYSGKVVINIK